MSILRAQLIEIIKNSLDKELYSNASFFAERLVNEHPDEDYIYLLAKAYIGEAKYHKAYNVLLPTTSSKCRYLMAQTCLKLGKHREAEKALIPDCLYNKNIKSKETEQGIPEGAAGFYLLGVLSEELNRMDDAIYAYAKSLEIDPFMWCSYTRICSINPEIIDTSKLFSDSNPKISGLRNRNWNNSGTALNPNTSIYNRSINQPRDFAMSPDVHSNLHILGIDNKYIMKSNPKPNSSFSYDENISHKAIENNLQNMTPVITKDRDQDLLNVNIIDQRKNKYKHFSISSPHNFALDFNKVENSIDHSLLSNDRSENNNSIKPFNITTSNTNFDVTPKDLKYGGILTSSAKSPLDVSNDRIKNTIFTNQSITHSSNKKAELINNLSTKHECLEKFNDVIELIKAFADIYKMLSLYRSEECIALINYLPIKHQKSGFMLGMKGKCYFEMNNYKESIKAYQESLAVEPSRLEGLEYYSTCLWHMKEQSLLSTLANHVLEQSHYCPETWLVVGNCYSLQKEHEVALKFFNRAIQLNPNFAYAYTLGGHECVENERYMEAKQLYTQAITLDQRHYNAWWGFGNILSKEQNYNEAIKYFKRAISINKHSAILHFYLGNVYQICGDINQCLHCLSTAESLDKDNSMIKYQKATIYYMNKQNKEALAILLELNSKLPREAPIHILLGKTYYNLHNYPKALYHFNCALELDSKDTNMTKAYIEKIYMENRKA